MARIVKSTLIFEGPGHGWTESYFQNRNDNSLLAAIANLKILAEFRAPCLGNGFYVKGGRCAFVTDVAGNRVRGESDIFYQRFNGYAQEDGADADLAVLTVWKGTDATKRKNQYLRGIWDTVSADEGRYNATPEWKLRFNALVAKYLEFQYGWYSRAQGAVSYAVTNYTILPGTYPEITVAGNPWAAPEFNIPQQVVFRGINTKSALNGTQVVIPTAAGTCRLSKPLALGEFVAAGTMRKLTYSFQQCGGIRGERIVSRKVGAPLLESRGRLRNRTRV